MMASFPCDQLIFQLSYLPQTSPPGTFINTSAVINDSEMGFFLFSCAISLPMCFPCSAQVSALSHPPAIPQLDRADGKMVS